MKKHLMPLQAALFQKFDTAPMAEPKVTDRPQLDRAGYYVALFEFLARETPEYGAIFKQAKTAIQRHAQRTAQGDHKAVLKALGEGLCLVPEIADFTKLPENQTYKILRQLMRAGMVTRTSSLKERVRGHRGGDNRSFLYWLKDE